MPVRDAKPVIPGRLINRDNFTEILQDAAHDKQITMEEANVILDAVEANLDSFDTQQAEEARAIKTLVEGANPQLAAAAVTSGDVIGFQSALRLHMENAADPPIEIHDVHSTSDIRRGIPLSSSEPLSVTGPDGVAFLVGGGRDIEGLEVRLRPITHSVHGDGIEARLKVSRKAGNAIEKLLAKMPDARLMEKKVRDYGVREDGAIVVHEGDDPLTQEEKDAAKLGTLNKELQTLNKDLAKLEKKLDGLAEPDDALETKRDELMDKIDELKSNIDDMVEDIGGNNYSYSYHSNNNSDNKPSMSLGHCVSVTEPGKFRIDYFPEEIAEQAMRGAVHIEAYGETEEEKKANLKAASEALGLNDEMETEPTEDSMELLMLMRLLWQASPEAAAKLAKKTNLTIEHAEAALEKARVPDHFIDDARFAEVVPGHISVVVPGQAEAYKKAGISGIVHTIQNTDKIAEMIASGNLSSTSERLATRKVIKGMSSSEDLESGGAEYVFTRLVTDKANNPSVGYSAAISFNLELLDRADWFAYPQDEYGSTYMDVEASAGKPSAALKKIAARTLPDVDSVFDELRGERNYASGSNSFFDRPTGRELIEAIDSDYYGGGDVDDMSNEAMFQGHIPVSMMNHIVVRNKDEQSKILKELKKLGITEVNGKPAKEFIRVQDKLYIEETTTNNDNTDYI